MKNNFILLLIFFLLLPLLNCRRRSSEPTEPTGNGYLTYENSNMGIKIDYPDVYVKMEGSDPAKKYVKFVCHLGDFSLFLAVYVLDLAPGVTIEEYNKIRKSLIDINYVFSNYYENSTLANNKAYVVESTCLILPLKMKSIWTFKNNKVYEITYIYEAQVLFDFMHMNQISRMVNSFDITN